jgi:threonine dehydrogenase-like Zn-dependent dehydrogenase
MGWALLLTPFAAAKLEKLRLMKTIVLDQPGQFRLIDTPEPGAPGPEEAVVRIQRVGICGTDLHAFEGTQPFFEYPRILGHELSAEIVALGSSERNHGLKVGDVVAVEPYNECGDCTACRQGRYNCCEKLWLYGVHRDGGMRELLTVPIRKLHLAEGVPLESLALVEMVGIGAHAVRRAAMQPGENVLVIGAGPIGLGTMAFARLEQVNVMAMDINPARLAFCRDNLGIEQTFDARETTPESLAADLGDLPLTVFDCTGSRASMLNAFNYVPHAGQLVFVGLVKDNIEFYNPHFHSHEITLKSSRNATAEDWRHVIASMQNGSVNTQAWVTHMVPPEGLVSDFASWLKPETGVIKAMLSF